MVEKFEPRLIDTANHVPTTRAAKIDSLAVNDTNERDL